MKAANAVAPILIGLNESPSEKEGKFNRYGFGGG